MDERAALVAAIAANPDDDTPRLAFADWLQEHGEESRAEFIRLQCELGRPVPRERYRHSEALFTQCTRLFGAYWQEWFRPLILALGADEPVPPLGRPYGPPGRAGGTVAIARLPPTSWTGIPDPAYFLEQVRIERGFATQLCIRTDYCKPPRSFAGAFRLEPITELDITLPTDPPNGRDLLEECLEQIRSLILHLVGPDDPSIPGGLAALLDFPGWSGLQAFELHHPYVGSPIPPRWIERILDCAWVEQLTAFSAGLTDAGLRLLRPSPASHNLTSLCLANSQLSADSISSLGTLRCHSGVKRLNLSHSGLRSRHIGALAASGVWDSLEDLDLSQNPIRDEGATALAGNGLLKQLRRLNLAATELNADGILAVAKAVDPDRIEVLNLESNTLEHVLAVSLCKRFGTRVSLVLDD
jgi:uncharacterized protein (TIGR02996 family)